MSEIKWVRPPLKFSCVSKGVRETNASFPLTSAIRFRCPTGKKN